MKTAVRNEFILEAHKSACSEWKLKIEKEFPKLFESKLEVGKWYNYYKGALLVWNNGENTYGFINGEYREDWSFRSKDVEPATEEEVKEALINEAKKRGFKNGVEIKSAYEKEGHTKIEIDDYIFYDKENNGLYSNSIWIFYNGKWAEIISNPIEEKINDLQKQLDELKKQL